MIKNISIEDLRVYSGKILSKAFFELGQNPDDETIVAMSVTLAEDLSKDFTTMEIQDIQEAFRIGIRETDKFHINIKTYYKWIRDHRQIIWNNDTLAPEMQDKRLHYRSRNGTGMKTISKNLSNLKYIK